MIISRTPLRISFAGGGTDMEWFYKKHPGAIVSCSINKYIYITVNSKFDSKIRVSYSKTEIVNRVTQIQHELVRESLKLTGIDGGIEITSIADVPSEGTGVGSSSAYTVGLLHALYAYRGRFCSANELAEAACQIEIDRVKRPIGKQDQYIGAHGGLQSLTFNQDGSVFVDPIIMNPKAKSRLAENLLMFYTGISRDANKILLKQKQNVTSSKALFQTMQEMAKIAGQMKAVLQHNDVDSFGELLHQNWLLKRNLVTGITNPKIDYYYQLARRQGALGGKICGAGGGGFLLLYAPKSRQSRIIASLSALRVFPVSFEPQGSKIIYVGD